MNGLARVNRLTTLSPIRRDRQRKLRRRLFIVRYVPGLGRPLLLLSFIHYARWTVLNELPAKDGRGGRTPLNSNYLLFESNYDGEEHDYLNTFADILPLRLTKLFGTCVGFEQNVEEVPGADGRVIAPYAFRNFVERNKLEILDFYAAAPTASVVRIQQALAYHKRSDRGDSATMALVPPTRRPSTKEAILAPFCRALTGRYGVSPFLVALPLKDAGAAEAVRTMLKTTQPLSTHGIETAHFARFVIIPKELQDLGQDAPDRLDVPYLMFTANHDHSWREFARATYRNLGGFADDLWGNCAGYPSGGEDEFVRWLGLHRLPTRYYVAGYPPHRVTTLTERLDALEMRGRLLLEGG